MGGRWVIACMLFLSAVAPIAEGQAKAHGVVNLEPEPGHLGMRGGTDNVVSVHAYGELSCTPASSPPLDIVVTTASGSSYRYESTTGSGNVWEVVPAKVSVPWRPAASGTYRVDDTVDFTIRSSFTPPVDVTGQILWTLVLQSEAPPRCTPQGYDVDAARDAPTDLAVYASLKSHANASAPPMVATVGVALLLAFLRRSR